MHQQIDEKHFCNGKPTINIQCPNQLICTKFLDYELIKSLNVSQVLKFVNAFECHTYDYRHFEQVSPDNKEPIFALSNGMIIRENGKHKNIGLQIFKVLFPRDTRPLVFDGKNFYTTNNITLLEPIDMLKDISILKGYTDE